MYHLDIYVGADLVAAYLALNDEDEVHDLTGATITSKLRSSLSSSSSVALTCTVLDAESGIFQVALTDTMTADFRPGTGVWDAFITQAGLTEPLIADGTYTIHQRASR